MIQNNQLKKIGKCFDVDKNLKRFSFENRNLFFTAFYWEDSIHFNIYREGVLEKMVESQNVNLNNYNLKEYQSRLNLKVKIKILVNRIRRKIFVKKINYKFIDLLSCISCHGDIKTDVSNVLFCQKCARKYDPSLLFLIENESVRRPQASASINSPEF